MVSGPRGPHFSEADAAADAAARTTALFGMVVAASMIAFQIGAKATRDAFFLTSFDITALPRMVIAAALVSVVVVLATTRLLTLFGPRRVVPVAFAVSAVFLLGEWGLATRTPKIASVVFYLHIAAFGSVLISSFWSLINESLDPRRAKRWIARISIASTAGGILGGLLAAAAGAWLTVRGMLPVLAGLHLLCGIVVLQIHPIPRTGTTQPPSSPFSGFGYLKRSSYLRALGTLVFVVTVAAVLLDYAFKASATARFTDEDSLIRFFAGFYTAIGVLTFLVQSLLGRVSLQRLGLARTVGTLPLIAGTAVAAVLVYPRLVAYAVARAAESVLRSSLYRSGFEVLFTPIHPSEKRATKTIVDVGFERAGDAVGGILITLALLAGAATSSTLLLVGTLVLFGVGLFIIPTIQRGFEVALQKSLMSRAEELEIDSSGDPNMATVMQSIDGIKWTSVISSSGLAKIRQSAPAREVPETSPSPRTPALTEPLFAKLADLRSRDPDRVRGALRTESRIEPVLVPQLISLLAWNEVSPDVIHALRRISPRIVGQLIDGLLDPEEEFAIRRRIPRIISTCETPRAVHGLKRGLKDHRFEVRYQVGLALDRLHDRLKEFPFERQEVFDAVLRELKVDKRVWESYRLIDDMESNEDSEFIDVALRERVSRSLAHVFNLLALTLPKDPLKIAFRGLHTADPTLRGTALEYLETVLPKRVRTLLWPFLEAKDYPRPKSDRNREEVLEDLLRSNASIQLDLSKLRKKPTEPA